MSEFIIPTKPLPSIKPELCNFDSEDAKLFENVPTALMDIVKQYICGRNSQTSNTINEVLNKSHRDKIEYVEAICSTYQLLMKAISDAFLTTNTTTKKINCKISGGYDSCYSKPSVDRWKRSNPAKMNAINIVIDHLTRKGWSPRIEGISGYTVDHDDGMYSGGHELMITCYFTE